MKKKNIYTMFMALMVLCIGGLLTACDKKDDEESKGTDPTPSGKTIVSKEYKDYLASTQMQSDVQTTIEGGMKLEALKWEMYKNFTNNFQLEGIKEYDPWNTPDWNHFYELATEFGQNADRYVEAMQNLYNNGMLTSNTPLTRVFTTIVGGYLKVKDTLYEGQEKVLNTMKQPGMNNNQKWEEMYNSLFYSQDRLGCDNWRDWRNKLVNREAGIIESTEIFEQLCQRNTDFKLAATEAGYGNDPVAETTRQVGGKLLEASVDVYGSAAATGSGVIGLAKDAYDVVSATGDLVKSVKNGDSQGVREAIGTYAGVIAGHVGGDKNNYAYTESFNAVQTAYKNTIEKSLSEAEAAENGANADTGVGVIEVEDKDTKSPGNTVIVDGPDGKTNIGLGKGGKTRVPTSETGTYKITTIDNTGDKNTTDLKIDKKGTTTNLEVKTNESELIDAQEEDKYDWDIEFDPEKLVVEAEGYHRVVTVITMYKSIKASSADNWIDVEVNGYNVHLDIKENTTGKERKGTINIYASDDGKNILKTATYDVTQLPYPDEGDGLAFMNFSKLRIDTIIGTGRVTATMNNVWRAKTRFANDDLSISRVSDTKYKVSIHVVDHDHIYMFDGEEKDPDPYYYVLPDRSYGAYYDLSFNIESVNPTIMFDKNNFRLTDLRAKGYYKFIDDLGHDYYMDFNCYFSGLGISDPMEFEDSNFKQATMDAENQDGEFYDVETGERVGGDYPFYVKLTGTVRWINAIYGRDEHGYSIVTGYEPYAGNISNESTSTNDAGLFIKLRWD